MRGLDDALSVGERIAFYRVRRGLTQQQLGVLVGRSTEWVSSIERGRRDVRRMDVLTATASALRVTLPELVGAQVLAETGPSQDDVPAVRDALMSPERLSRVLYASSSKSAEAVESARNAVRYCEHVWGNYQDGAIGRVLAALPGLLGTARGLELADHPEG